MNVRTSLARAAALLLAAGAWACPPAALAGEADWPQHQHDARRSGFTPHEVAPPYKVAWTYCFLPERPARRTQAVVCGGRVYVGTQQGVMHCLDAATGKPLWRSAKVGSIQHSAGCADGKVFFGALDGCVYALDARTGEPAWKARTDAGFTVAPLLAGGRVFLGNRRGTFFTLDQRTGREVWRHRIPAPIFNTAATDGEKVFFGGEDMRVYALDVRTGRRVWVGPRLWGMSLKDYHPVVHASRVIVRPMTSFEADIYTGRYSKYGSWPNALPGGWWPVWKGAPPGRKAFDERYAEAQAERAGRMPPELLKAQEAVIEHFRQHPEDQDMFVLDAATGRQALVAPHFRVQSMHGPVTPPVVDPDGLLIVPWVHINHGWARYDLATNRLKELLIPPRPTNADENLNVSCGGRYVFVLHVQEGNANYTGVYDLTARRWWPVPPARVAWYDNLQSGGNPASVAAGRFFHILFYTLVARTTAEDAK